MKEINTPELCSKCYWRLSGCVPEGAPGTCWCFQPAGYEDDWGLPAERDYDPGDGADAWGRAGFTVFESAEAMRSYYEGTEADAAL